MNIMNIFYTYFKIYYSIWANFIYSNATNQNQNIPKKFHIFPTTKTKHYHQPPLKTTTIEHIPQKPTQSHFLSENPPPSPTSSPSTSTSEPYIPPHSSDPPSLRRYQDVFLRHASICKCDYSVFITVGVAAVGGRGDGGRGLPRSVLSRLSRARDIGGPRQINTEE